MLVINNVLGNDFPDDNQIIKKGEFKFLNSKIIFRGKGGVLEIGNNVNLSDCIIDIGNGAKVNIGDESQFRGEILVGVKSSVCIGKKVTVTNNLHMKIGEVRNIAIGDDCIIGSNVKMRTTDGHPIYDIRTKERLNKSASIRIGRHVWIADDCLILKGADIGNGSIVASRSILTRAYEKNSLIDGSPAKIIKLGVTWERNPGDFTEEFYVS